MNLQKQIYLSVINEYSRLGLATELTNYTDDEACRFLFHNYTSTSNCKRLTTLGKDIISELFDSFEIKLPADFIIAPKHTLYLNRHLKLPYYYVWGDNRRLILFHPDDGVRLRLVDGDIDKLIRMKKKIQQ